MQTTNFGKWLRLNLFAKPFDVCLTLIVVPLLIWTAFEAISWALTIAQWDVITSSAKVLMTGIFPPDQLWRAWFTAGAIGLTLALTAAAAVPVTRSRTIGCVLGIGLLTSFSASISASAGLTTLIIVAVCFIVWLLGSRFPFLRRHAGKISAVLCIAFVIVLYPVGPSNWGGLLLSVVLTIGAAVLTIPVGLMLAFGRQSKVGSIRTLATAYIEVMRAVPLILIVYWIWIAQPLLLPSLHIPDVIRGLIGFVLFYAAYAAEYIRSGLQAVPRGQIEAAEALGFSDWDIKRIIVMPQAMRVAMPGLVGNTLDIFNYAPLVFIIGLTDFLRAGQMILANPQNSSQTYEVYAFLFVVYFAIGSVITFMARRLESHFGKGSHR